MGALTVTHWSLLEPLPDRARADVLQSTRRRHFARGEVVFHEGDPADSLHLIDSGIFVVQMSAPTGERLTLNVLTAGNFFGELALLRSEGAQRSATVTALVPSQTLAMPATAFAVLRTSQPSIDELVVSALAQRVEDLSLRLFEALYLGADRRVYRRLLELADIYDNSSAGVVIPMSQDDLASMAGASRPTVNQILRRLVARRIITVGRRQITIVDLASLRRAAPPL